ncbi:MAG: hypothetical protein JWN25_1802 [Verrucomicrobiales bacterium]|nr:hypothetical protein [Verrucomicrobiales bacterium]
MNTKRQSTKFLPYLHASDSVHSRKVPTKKCHRVSHVTTPVLLGKSHFRVTFLAISKCGIPSVSKHPRPPDGKSNLNSNIDPKSKVQPMGKCPNPVLKMSFLQKTKFRIMKTQSQPASVVNIRRMRGALHKNSTDLRTFCADVIPAQKASLLSNPMQFSRLIVHKGFQTIGETFQPLLPGLRTCERSST